MFKFSALVKIIIVPFHLMQLRSLTNTTHVHINSDVSLVYTEEGEGVSRIGASSLAVGSIYFECFTFILLLKSSSQILSYGLADMHSPQPCLLRFSDCLCSSNLLN